MKISSIILSFILSILLLFSSLRITFTYVYYELDPVGFIEMLCKNKDKPELQCNGKCHLKKIAESSSENNQEPANIISIKDITLFVIEKLIVDFLSFKESDKNLTYYQNFYAFHSIYTIDHPPKV